MSFKGWIYRDLLRPIAEVDASGNVTARYVYEDGARVGQNGAHQVATRLGANQDTSLPFSGDNVPLFIEHLDASGRVTERLRLVTNQVGTVELVTDAATGNVVQRIEYDEFGRVVLNSAPGFQPFGFAGGLVDEATGLVRFGARDYEPVVGRWIARDPARFAGSDNPFLYALSDPNNRIDSGGLTDGAVARGCAEGCVTANIPGVCRAICEALYPIFDAATGGSESPRPVPVPVPVPMPDACAYDWEEETGKYEKCQLVDGTFDCVYRCPTLGIKRIPRSVPKEGVGNDNGCYPEYSF